MLIALIADALQHTEDRERDGECKRERSSGEMEEREKNAHSSE